jgi:hypothetical protein
MDRRVPGTKAPKNMRALIDAKPSDWPCRHPGCERHDLSLGRHRCERHRVFEQLDLGLDELVLTGQ